MMTSVVTSVLAVIGLTCCAILSAVAARSCTESGRCCPDGVSRANDSFLTGCPVQPTSSRCSTYLQFAETGVADIGASKSTTCTTTTNCLAFTCVYQFKQSSPFLPTLAIDWIFNAGCQWNISGLLRVSAPKQRFTWTHEFVGNSSAFVEGLRWRWNRAILTDMYVKVQLYRVGSSVSFGVWLQSVVPVTTNSSYLLWSEAFTPQALLPTNTSQCQVGNTISWVCPGCQDTCIRSVYGHEGVCYKCFNRSCLPASGHHVCGSDGHTYSNECLLRKKACRQRQEIRTEYSGSCSAMAPAGHKIVASWPSSYDNLPQETVFFIDHAVVFILIGALKIDTFLANKVLLMNFKSTLSQITSYNIAVPHISTESNINVNLTLYALYHSSEKRVLPGYQLLDVLRRYTSSIEEALSFQVLAIDRPWGSSCLHKQQLIASPQCLDFVSLGLLEKPKSFCTTTTNCQQIDCLSRLGNQGISSELTVTFHKCAHPLSVDIHFVVHQFNFSWRSRFTGNASVIVPGLNMSRAGVTVQIRLILKLFLTNGHIYFSAATDPILPASSGNVDSSVTSVFKRKMLPLGLVPLDDAECTDPPSRGCCLNCNGRCLWSLYGGTVCYVCPRASCLISQFPVCGIDGVTYDSECSLRKKACQLGQQSQIDYSGPCREVRPSLDYYPITEWPARVEDIPPEFEAFVRAAVLFVLVDVPELSVSSYNRSFFEIKFSVSLGYRVIVPFFSFVGSRRSRRHSHSHDNVNINVTMYAQYWSSENVTVPSVELLDAINSVEANLEVVLNADIVSVAQSYESEMPEPAHEDNSLSSGVIVAIAIVVVVVVVVLTVIVAVAVLWWKRKNGNLVGRASDSGTSEGKKPDDVVYLTESDQKSVDNPVN